MKNPFSGLIVVGLLLVAFFAITNSVYTVHQTEQALVLRFGEPAPGRALVPDPGIHCNSTSRSAPRSARRVRSRTC